MNKRSDYGNKADDWFADLDEGIAPIAVELRTLIQKAVPDATESIKWGMPNYDQDGQVCAIRPGKGYVALQFGSIGTSLADSDKLLEGTGKQMRHVKIHASTDIKKRLFTAWIKQAAKTNSS